MIQSWGRAGDDEIVILGIICAIFWSIFCVVLPKEFYQENRSDQLPK
jgi:hypothetical protein